MAQTGIALAAIAGIFLSLPGWSAPSDPALMATPPQPSWQELTTAQKIILAPLCDDWDAMEYYRQKTWLSIAARFPEMTPKEQRRIQEQMQTWAKLSPEEQIIAREIYQRTAKMPSAQKQLLRQQWEEYSNLPESEKEKLKRAVNKRPAAKTARPAAAASSLTASGPSAPTPTQAANNTEAIQKP